MAAEEEGKRVTDIPVGSLFVEVSHPVARSRCCKEKQADFLGIKVEQT